MVATFLFNWVKDNIKRQEGQAMAEYGIILALENHGGITATSEQMMALIKAVNSKWFGVTDGSS